MKILCLTFIGGLLVASSGCSEKSAAATPETNNAQKQGNAQAASTKVARIVFVDKEGACACTRERADTSWKELQAALGKDSKLPVERLYLDTQPEKVEPYFKQAKLMVVPGVYLLTADNKLVELLQGEVTQDQLRLKLGS